MDFFNILNDFKKLCNERNECAAVACRVYIDMISDKKYCSICKCYDRSLGVFYLKAESLDKTKTIILPSLITQELDLNVIHKLKYNEEGQNIMRHIFKYFIL